MYSFFTAYTFFTHLSAGPTSFAPVIEMATTIVEQSGGQYHVLLIIADGQVLSSVPFTYFHRCYFLVILDFYIISQQLFQYL